MHLRETVKRAATLMIMLLLLMAISRGMTAQEMNMQPEEAIVYENDVAPVIQQQLHGLDLAAIRAKEALILDKDLASIQAAVAAGTLRYAELTAFYLDRIARYDKGDGGINAVVQVNPEAMARARALDAARDKDKGPLYGIPVLLKDNINAKGMATSAGTHALMNYEPKDDAPAVARLLSEQAIILGKANLSELANFVDENMPNGYSSRLGQTRNPFAPGYLSPLGSSAGSAAAVAANLAPVSLGTETTGSIIAPAAIHSLVGMKPTWGRISTEGVLPLAASLDTVGPIAKSVRDAAALYNAAVSDPAQQVVLEARPSLAGKRIGLLVGENSDQLKEALIRLGAVPVDLDWQQAYFGNEEIITGEFARDFAAFADKHGLPVKTLRDLAAYNAKDMGRRARFGQGLILEAAEADIPREQVQQHLAAARAFLREQAQQHQLDAFAFYNDQGCAVPCVAGAPMVTVPFGKNQFEEPVGATFVGLPDTDQALMNLALAFEQGSSMRQIPTGYLEHQ